MEFKLYNPIKNIQAVFSAIEVVLSLYFVIFVSESQFRETFTGFMILNNVFLCTAHRLNEAFPDLREVETMTLIVMPAFALFYGGILLILFINKCNWNEEATSTWLFLCLIIWKSITVIKNAALLSLGFLLYTLGFRRSYVEVIDETFEGY